MENTGVRESAQCIVLRSNINLLIRLVTIHFAYYSVFFLALLISLKLEVNYLLTVTILIIHDIYALAFIFYQYTMQISYEKLEHCLEKSVDVMFSLITKILIVLTVYADRRLLIAGIPLYLSWVISCFIRFPCNG